MVSSDTKGDSRVPGKGLLTSLAVWWKIATSQFKAENVKDIIGLPLRFLLSIIKEIMIYDIYHDESKKEAFWHVFLFMPKNNRREILKYLEEARQMSGFKGKDFSFKKLHSAPSFECAGAWISILVAALQQKRREGLEPFYLGKTGYNCPKRRRLPLYRRFSQVPKCKIGIFHEKYKHKDMTGHLDSLSKIETTFRMGLQGATHYLFNEDNPLEIRNIFLDREKHYRMAYKRDFDKGKVLDKLSIKFRDYCYLHPQCKISGENLNNSDLTFLDLADIFLGIFRFGVLNTIPMSYKDKKEENKFYLCNRISLLVERLNKGYARMKNSRFEDFGTFSSAWIEDGDWRFEDLACKFLEGPAVENLTLF